MHAFVPCFGFQNVNMCYIKMKYLLIGLVTYRLILAIYSDTVRESSAIAIYSDTVHVSSAINALHENSSPNLVSTLLLPLLVFDMLALLFGIPSFIYRLLHCL